MEIQKIKDWIKRKPQFKAEGVYQGGEIKYVTRLKDEYRFYLFFPYPGEEEESITITWFHSDLIHVDVDFSSPTIIGKKGTYEINDLVITGINIDIEDF